MLLFRALSADLKLRYSLKKEHKSLIYPKIKMIAFFLKVTHPLHPDTVDP